MFETGAGVGVCKVWERARRAGHNAREPGAGGALAGAELRAVGFAGDGGGGEHSAAERAGGEDEVYLGDVRGRRVDTGGASCSGDAGGESASGGGFGGFGACGCAC